jgi:hypothetical protein
MISTCANGHVSRQRNPQIPLALGFLKDGGACRLTQNRFWRVAEEKPRRGQLDLRDLADILCPRANDRVVPGAGGLTRESPQSGLHQRRQLGSDATPHGSSPLPFRGTVTDASRIIRADMTDGVATTRTPGAATNPQHFTFLYRSVPDLDEISAEPAPRIRRLSRS